MSTIGDYNEIMSSRTLFNEVVYTPLSQALKILEERQKDVDLVKKIDSLLNGDVPSFFKKNNNCAVMCRQISTPNYDVRSFISISLDNNLTPVFFEYPNDKFVPSNEFKKSLGQIIIHDRIDKSGNFIEERFNIIDFNLNNGKKLNEIITIKGDSLYEFHQKLFSLYEIDIKNIYFIDGSNWVNKNGKKADEYYYKLFLLFVCNGIIFENFLTDEGPEGEFTKKIVLQAIEKVIKNTGLKPLIVPIPPMDIENDNHWLSHCSIIKNFLLNKKI